MSLIDFILNIAGLLLWLSWRSVRLDPFHRGIPATLAGTVRRAEPLRLKRWHFLAGLGALLLIRAFFYGQIGPAVGWTPKLNLSVITPAFPLTRAGHVFYRSAFLFSLLSFILVLVTFYFWLLALAVINRRVANPDPLQKLLLLQLGRVARWPLLLQLALPFLVCCALWMLCHPLLVHVGVTSPVKSNVVLLEAGVVSHVKSNAVLLEQGLVLGLALYLSLKFLLIAFLCVYVIVSYVYLGPNPLWEFVTTTSRNLLSPLERLPLRAGKLDLVPVIAIALLVLVLYWPLPERIGHLLDRRGLTLWPQ